MRGKEGKRVSGEELRRGREEEKIKEDRKKQFTGSCL